MAQISTQAPGRICLFGDHQDYLELPIIACAINRYIRISGKPNDSDQFHITLSDLGKKRSICFRESELNPTKNDHLAACIKAVSTYDCIPNNGYDIIITGDIPINAGLSSSSAVVVAWVQWLLVTFGCNREITPEFVAQIAYEAEVVMQNSPGGKMDQYTSAMGNIIYLETDQQSYIETLGNQLEGLIIGVSGIPKDTIGLLGDLRGNALKAIAIIKEKYPSFDLASAKLRAYETYENDIPEGLQPYFYAAIQNHLITKEALVCFRARLAAGQKSELNLEKIGKLMTAHHTVLRDSLKITVPRIDAMIDAALSAGAYGAKIVGSGGGGSICALAPKDKEQDIIKAIKNAGAVEAYAVQVAKGVHTL